MKCDIKRFFANIDHDILKNILTKYIRDKNVLWLLAQIIDSFNTERKNSIGLPLGNLTSQLFVNIYMNELDQFLKRKLKIKYYIRYADDFIILHTKKSYLENIIPNISKFLRVHLKLILHPDKIFIKTLFSGMDFLGWVNFFHCRILRTTTKHRMLRRIGCGVLPEAIISYLGLLSHGNTYKLSAKIKNDYFY